MTPRVYVGVIGPQANPSATGDYFLTPVYGEGIINLRH